MTLGSLARRYAAALFDVVKKSGDLERAGHELSAFSAMIAGHDQLRKTFDTPGVPPQRKRAIAQALIEQTGGISPEVSRLVLLLADRDRLSLVGAVSAAYDEKVMTARRIVPAEVVTATPLGDDRRAGLAHALGQAAGAEVRLTARVEPAIIGGLVARVGSVVFDGSITRQLERMRQRLLSEP